MKESENRSSIPPKLKVQGDFKICYLEILFHVFLSCTIKKVEHAICNFYVFCSPLSSKNIVRAVNLVLLLIIGNK